MTAGLSHSNSTNTRPQGLDVRPSSDDTTALHVLLPTIGSAGDVYPVIGLGLALQARGHRATILTNAYFRELIEKCGLAFLEVGTVEEARATVANPDLWHPRKGFEVVARNAIVPAIARVFKLIEKHADDHTVVVASGISLGARVAQEKLGVPAATVHLQPSIIRSRVDQGMAGNIRISSTQPMWFKDAFFRIADWLLIDRNLKQPLNEFRASVGLPPVSRVMHRWIHSPQLVIGFFPDWFAAPQPDWPPHTHLVGFPLWDAGHMSVPSEVDEYLDRRKPLVFTPGSAGATMHRYFHESVEAARELGEPALLVTNFPEQLPASLPPNIKVCGYIPFSRTLSRAALLVYHGGIGTLAQTLKAGIPHLVVPNGHDQFDNGWRVEQLRLGKSIPQTRYRAARVAQAIRELLSDSTLAQRCADYSSKVDPAAAFIRACELIEGLAARAGRAETLHQQI
jgi:rhamnosyltransferase subunit B